MDLQATASNNASQTLTSKKFGTRIVRAMDPNDFNRHHFNGRIPELICLEITLQAAAALGVAHAKGLVHGDVKPENIMVTFQGMVKVLDFGLVQFANAEKLLSNEETYAISGTPLYIPPERVRGEPEDFRSDLYSLGASLYHMLRGLPPFRAKDPGELAMMHTSAPMLKFKGVAPWVSDTACRIVEKSLKKTVSERYSSHAEFMADLTLARNLLLQANEEKPRDGSRVLKEFLETVQVQKKRKWFWQKG
jgi:serine/threonine protein kinase